MHRIEIDPALTARLREARGGALHLFEDLDPARTAYLIVDMQNGFMEPGAPVEVPFAREIVPNVNAIARRLRDAGGTNIFLQFATPANAPETWSSFYARLPAAFRDAHLAAFAANAHYWRLWPELEVDPRDLRVDKHRFDAFIPGTCVLDELLVRRGIETLIISGTLTNCCCESTARDAMQRNYKVIFVSDANATLTDTEHNATLNNLCALFCDVMSTDEVLAAIDRATRVETGSPSAVPV